MRDAGALANALDDVGTKVNDEIAFVRMLADLDLDHIRVLKIMIRRPKHLDRVAVQMNAADDPRAARQWYAWSIVEADPGLEGSVHGALRVLLTLAIALNRHTELRHLDDDRGFVVTRLPPYEPTCHRPATPAPRPPSCTRCWTTRSPTPRSAPRAAGGAGQRADRPLR